MKLGELAPLYKDMRAQKLDRIRFDYRHGRVSFDVFFFIDESPYLLLFGARGYNVAFEVEVRPGFEIDPRLDNADFRALCNALGLVFNPDNRFSTKRSSRHSLDTSRQRYRPTMRSSRRMWRDSGAMSRRPTRCITAAGATTPSAGKP